MATIQTNNEKSYGNRWRVAAWATAAILLLVPWIAMQFTDQVVWDVVDFTILAGLLAGVGVTLELAFRKTGNSSYRMAVGVALAATFVLVGVSGAVGIIGTEKDGANLMFAGVLVAGLLGSVIARFQPRGMARAMFATAGVQVVVGAIALIAGLGSKGPIWPFDILSATGFFTALWLVAAWLFRKAALELK